ncbi:hypothetical protein DPMN_050521 [Dreissena polymorpha]|uniref:Uncharacterized protein n=1 Tax=Dreissena polymorpha TaxID=45954 RepID=A0A9D4CGA3_DREPO|nr:hypothetical protein DPMN_050521 [Dreissena polymorpha]
MNQLASQICLKVQVGDILMYAVVDSAADVNIIFDRVYASKKQPPSKLRDVKLLMTGRDSSMQGFVVDPVRLKIGFCWYQKQL